MLETPMGFFIEERTYKENNIRLLIKALYMDSSQ